MLLTALEQNINQLSFGFRLSYWVGGIIAILLLIYLVYALIKPEKL
jgi:K+-transporting ATPase KdpF subunit